MAALHPQLCLSPTTPGGSVHHNAYSGLITLTGACQPTSRANLFSSHQVESPVEEICHWQVQGWLMSNFSREHGRILPGVIHGIQARKKTSRETYGHVGLAEFRGWRFGGSKLSGSKRMAVTGAAQHRCRLPEHWVRRWASSFSREGSFRPQTTLHNFHVAGSESRWNMVIFLPWINVQDDTRAPWPAL